MSTSASYKHTSRLQPCTYCSVLWHKLDPFPRPSLPLLFKVLAANPPGGQPALRTKGGGKGEGRGAQFPFCFSLLSWETTTTHWPAFPLTDDARGEALKNHLRQSAGSDDVCKCNMTANAQMSVCPSG
jgi:hypothetical protein